MVLLTIYMLVMIRSSPKATNSGPMKKKVLSYLQKERKRVHNNSKGVMPI